MKSSQKTNRKYLLCILCIAVFSLAGYLFLSASPSDTERTDTWAESGFLKVGHHLTIQNTDNQLSLLDSKDVLSANGLYYATWTMGDPEPYENSEGETIDLYDAQLYLVLAESKKEEEALKNVTKWSEAAKNNYEILTEEKITCNGLSCHLITYNCVSESNPYDRGISVFGAWQDTALCAELTCQKEFEQDLRNILMQFLNSFTFE